MRRARTLLLVGLMFACASGCNILGFASQAIGPPPVEAQYIIDGPLLILAEDYRDPDASYVESEQLEQYVYYELTTNGVGPVIEPGKLSEFRATNSRRLRSMSVADIGRALGANEVLYIHVERGSLQLAQGSEMLKGSASARVKLIESHTAALLWPADTPGGRYVSVETPMVREEEGVTETYVRQGMQRALAAQIARFFYKYKPQ